MKIGKVPESVLVRSVLRQVKTKREEVLVGADVGEDCAVMKLAEDEVFVISTDPITGTVHDIGNLAIQITANDLASSGAKPIAVMLTILLPPQAEEADLKSMMKQVEEACHNLDMQIIGGHTEVTAAVRQTVVTVTGIGKIKEEDLVVTSGAKPEQDVILTKWIALEGTSIIAKEKESLLRERFPQSIVQTARDFDQYISVVPESVIAVEHGVSSMHDVTEGGVFGALWEMAQSSEVGLEIDLKKIPVRQETIEICECFDINPYQLISSGSMLITSEKGHQLVDKLKKEGIEASVIGRTTGGNDRVIFNGEDKRFLDKPKTDELYKIYETDGAEQ